MLLLTKKNDHQASLSYNQILYGATLGFAVVSIVQMISIDTLSIPLYIALCCFAVSVPVLVLVFILNERLTRVNTRIKRRSSRNMIAMYLGPAPVGIAFFAILWHFSPIISLISFVFSILSMRLFGGFLAKIQIKEDMVNIAMKYKNKQSEAALLSDLIFLNNREER